MPGSWHGRQHQGKAGGAWSATFGAAPRIRKIFEGSGGGSWSSDRSRGPSTTASLGPTVVRGRMVALPPDVVHPGRGRPCLAHCDHIVGTNIDQRAAIAL